MPGNLARNLVEALEPWQNQIVAIRVVTSSNDLVTVFAGRLGPRSDEKAPALFLAGGAGSGCDATV
jgi:hypothetical protein